VGPSTNFWNYLAAPVYWKNWNIVTLPATTAQPYGHSGGASYMGTDVYIDGQINNTSGAATPVYWRNGTLVQLPVPSPYVGATESELNFVDF